MKVYNRYFNYETGEYEVTIIVGLKKEIESTVRALWRASDNDQTMLKPLYLDKPKFGNKRTYGIFVNNVDKEFCVISADTAMVYILAEGGDE